MISFVVNLHGAQGTRGEAAASNIAVERRLTAVSVQVFAQVDHVLTPCKHNIECVSSKNKVTKCRSVRLSFRGCHTCIRSNRSCMASRCCGGT